MKLTVIGGGGVRSPFLAKSIAYHADRVGISQVFFVDNDEEKLAIYGILSQEIFKRMRPDIPFLLTNDAIEAISDADVIISTLRVGGDQGRIDDEQIALAHGLLGQETTGAGGFAMALRSIPTILQYCQYIEHYASPEAILFNFTNPSGLVTEAILKSGFKHKVYGICDAPSEFLREVAALLACDGEVLSMDCFGLNHLSWFGNVNVNGEDHTLALRDNPQLYMKTAQKYFSPDLIRLNDNHFLNEYLYYYFYREKAVMAVVNSQETRAQQIARINKAMMAALKQVDIVNQLEDAFSLYYHHYLERDNSYMSAESGQDKPHKMAQLTLQDFLSLPDTGGYAGVAIDILEATVSEQYKRVVVCRANQGTLPFLLDDDVIEITCELSRHGLNPITVTHVPELARAMISQVKGYERLSVQAILQHDKQLALQALTMHPLINSYSLAHSLLDHYLAAQHLSICWS